MAMNKIGALYIKQMKNFAYNMFVIVGLLAPLLVTLMFTYLIPPLKPMALPMGILFNITFGGANTMCVLIAEEKEKNTLNVLITSTVSAIDFLLSNALATLTLIAIVNILVYFICAAYTIPFILFVLITSLGSLAGIVLGAIIGIVSKNQMSASTIISPFALILLFIPMLSAAIPLFQDIGNVLFSQQTTNILAELSNGDFSLWRVGVILANLLVFIIIFALVYKRVGIEK